LLNLRSEFSNIHIAEFENHFFIWYSIAFPVKQDISETEHGIPF